MMFGGRGSFSKLSHKFASRCGSLEDTIPSHMGTGHIPRANITPMHGLYKALLLQLLRQVLVEAREQDGAQNYLPTCQMGKLRPPGRVIC